MECFLTRIHIHIHIHKDGNHYTDFSYVYLTIGIMYSDAKSSWLTIFMG